MSYGTPAPKVAETVKRTRDFNKKNDNIRMPLFHVLSEKTHWNSEGPFPFDEITGNWHPGEFCRILRIFLCSNQTLIDQ